MFIADQILSFLSGLQWTIQLPDGVAVMNPYREPETWMVCTQFYRQYYSDEGKRALILGINPGRFGGGITGIPFTDPVALEKECGIPTTMNTKRELSSEFIYRMIGAYGGPGPFYRQYYISALSPLGFTKEGKNLNYYDDKELQRKVTPFIIASLKAQLDFGLRQDVCFCLGEGKNFKFLSALNATHHFFETIIPLAHPRFIMQYRRKKLNHYVAEYLAQLKP